MRNLLSFNNYVRERRLLEISHRVIKLWFMVFALTGTLCSAHLSAHADSEHQDGKSVPSLVAPKLSEQNKKSDRTRTVWQDIAVKYSPNEVFEKIMKLANRGWVTREEVENTFDVKLRLSREGPQNENIYVAGISSFPNGIDFAYYQNVAEKRWALVLSRLTDPFYEGHDSCISYPYALGRILSMGWEQREIGLEIVEYEYIKRTETMGSRLHITDSSGRDGTSCLDSIQFSNAPLK